MGIKDFFFPKNLEPARSSRRVEAMKPVEREVPPEKKPITGRDPNWIEAQVFIRQRIEYHQRLCETPDLPHTETECARHVILELRRVLKFQESGNMSFK